MKKLLYVMMFVMSLMIGFSCTTKETKVINDTPTLEVRSQILEPWDEKNKHFWISVYFAKLSYDPNMRQRFLPHILYGVCECIINEFEKHYTLEEFQTKVQNDNAKMVSPEVKQQIWNISYGCSQIGIQKQMKEMLKFQQQILVNPV